uniref:Retrotransposon Copia-like N-terminal domain-containing protein n=1 Tax=Nicotiana tabacum TaxID=4097 RepID=A0A1S3YQJ7_TOBAC|nr:PREDICTED: uncharacterized protein LOC107778556 [Nicotiana tabacum]
MTGSTSSSAYTPDPTSPLFLLSSDVPGVSLVPIPFSGSGFGGWKRSMIVSLSARNKIAFIDGSFPKPAATSPDYKQWHRCNNMVISWLTSSLSPDRAESVQYSETAKSIWKQLNNRTSNLFYKYCKKPGHLIDKCYKLHGFPTNFKFTKGRKAAANMVTDSEFSAFECTSSN